MKSYISYSRTELENRFNTLNKICNEIQRIKETTDIWSVDEMILDDAILAITSKMRIIERNLANENLIFKK